MLTTQQQIDFDIWKQDQSQPLPDSLKNVLIDRCLKTIISTKVTENFNSVNKSGFRAVISHKIYKDGFEDLNKLTVYFDKADGMAEFKNLPRNICLLIIIGFLSRTPDGQAVMPFLNVETKESREILKKMQKIEIPQIIFNPFSNKFPEPVLKNMYAVQLYRNLNSQRQTLDHLLYQEFTEALRIGKTFDQALEIMTKTYLLNQYV